MTTEVVPVANPSIEIGQHRVDSLDQRLFKTIRNTFFFQHFTKSIEEYFRHCRLGTAHGNQ